MIFYHIADFVARLHVASCKYIYTVKVSFNKINLRLLILFNIEGNTASSLQFYLTDSTNHFLRGALYFNVVPNIDSLRVVVEFIKKDVLHMINTTHWKKNVTLSEVDAKQKNLSTTLTVTNKN